MEQLNFTVILLTWVPYPVAGDPVVCFGKLQTLPVGV